MKYVWGENGYWRKCASAAEPATRMASGRRKNGRTDPLDGLEQDSAGPDRIMASKPPHNCQPLPCFKLSYLAGLRSTACADLQRRLLADLRRKTPSCNGNRLQRVLGFSMARDRRSVYARARGGDFVP